MLDKVYEPILPPTIHEADPRADLLDVEQKMYDDVLQHFSDPTYSLPGIEEKGELTEAEKFWLSRECLLRYLRAVKWKTTKAAIQRLEATLKWRREYGLYDVVSANHVEPEVRNKNFLVKSTLALLINYGDKAKNPSLGVARTVLNILQDHYPERLGVALILNVPFLLNAFYKLINPFIDPVSREKMKFNPRVIEDNLFTPDMVISEWWGGDCDFEYVHDKYWPALLNLCESRRKAFLEKWRVLGGTVGLKEWEYKGRGTTSVIHPDPQAADIEKVVDAPVQVDVSPSAYPLAA
ncbi:hypothetical protein C0993_003782 [Termitomyces sp. T159_Od127]|nr:hypothetical protein C0993_003782 [Termitomyces sp. T159_Od127]